jgi:exopolyphosphatase/guanosine-5'-triphosphate,3'-diphosphate pyrophosphatase
MKVAKVNICLPGNTEIIYKNEIKVPYAENYQAGFFNPKIRDAGISALLQLKNEAISNGAEAFAGVATESFRRVADAREFIGEVKEKTSIAIDIIDQDQEAVLGYQAVSQALNVKNDKIVVWDIGGGSMQMICRQRNQKFIIYRGKIASVSFKEKILAQIKRKNPQEHSSPNPIGKENLQKAMEMAMAAAEDVPTEIKSVIRQQETIIIGIGGVHDQSIKKQMGSPRIYTQEDLIKVLKVRSEWSDKEIGGIYADTEISNLILVLGFMEKLGIKEVIPLDINLADGILISPAFW